METVPSVGVICPLQDPELSAVLAISDGPYREHHHSSTEDIPFFIGTVGGLCVVATAFAYQDIGLGAASERSRALDRAFPDLKYRFLVGIAGGVPDDAKDVRLGDVVIATEVFKHDFGRYTTDGFERTGHERALKPAPAVVRNSMLSKFRRAENAERRGVIDEHLQSMRSQDPQWDRPEDLEDVLFQPTYDCISPDKGQCETCDLLKVVDRPRRETLFPRVHDGLVASGDAVMKYGVERESLKADLTGKDIGVPLAIEMEAALLTDYIVVRGICDYADSHKNKRWQRYAAATAAACFKELLLCLPEPREDSPVPGHDVPETGLPPRGPKSQSQEKSGPDHSPSDATPLTPSPGDLNGSSQNATQDLPKGKNNEENLTVRFSAQVLGYKVYLPDFSEIDTKPVYQGDAASITLFESAESEHFMTIKRLMISPQSANHEKLSIWMPLDGITTSREDCRVGFQFSDCRRHEIQRENDNKAHYCRYDETDPNITIKLQMSRPEGAESLQAYLLHQKPQSLQVFVLHPGAHSLQAFLLDQTPAPTASENSAEASPSKKRIRCQIRVQSFSDSLAALFLAEFDNPAMVLVYYATKFLDFNDIAYDPQPVVRFRNLRKIKYKANDAIRGSWPLKQEVSQDTDGKPEEITLEGDHCLSLEFAEVDALTLFLTQLTGWTLAFCECASEHRTLTKSRDAHITVWSKEDELRILCHDPKRDSWVSSSLTRPPPSRPESSPSLSQGRKESVVLLQDVQTSKGTRVLRTTLAATDDDTVPDHQELSHSFTFENPDTSRRFKEVVGAYVNSPSSSSIDSRSSVSSAHPS